MTSISENSAKGTKQKRQSFKKFRKFKAEFSNILENSKIFFCSLGAGLKPATLAELIFAKIKHKS